MGKGSASETEFKVGRDISSLDRFTTLRHVPTTRRMMEALVPQAQPNYDTLPTWTRAAPHNIRRITEQNKACNNCHGNQIQMPDSRTSILKEGKRAPFA